MRSSLAGFTGTIKAYGQSFKAVVIKGAVNYTYSAEQLTQHTAMGSTDSDEGNKTIALGAGSFLESTGESQHKVNNTSDGEVLVYIRADKPFQVSH